MKSIKPKYVFPFNPQGGEGGFGFGVEPKPNKEEIKKAVVSHAKKHKQIIHGSFGLREQIGEFARTPQDIDIMTRNPKHHMDVVEDKLDLMAGRDAFAELIMPIRGKEGEYVYKVVKKVYGLDKDVVDYFNLQRGVQTKTIKGIRYEHWKFAKRRLEQIVADPELRHRHGKALQDLRRIEAYEKSLRR